MSVIATALQHMLAAGMEHADIVAAVAAMEVSAVVVDEAAERRRAKDRERKQKVRGNPRKSAESAESADTPKSVPPKPPSKITPIPPLKGGTFPTEAPPEKPTFSGFVGKVWDLTPRPGRERSGRRDLENALRAAIRRGADPNAIAAGVAGYYASPDATKDQGQFAKGVHVVVSSGRWEAFADSGADGPPPDDDPWPRRLREFQRNGFWNTTDWGPKPGKSDSQASTSLLEQAA